MVEQGDFDVGRVGSRGKERSTGIMAVLTGLRGCLGRTERLQFLHWLSEESHQSSLVAEMVSQGSVVPK